MRSLSIPNLSRTRRCRAAIRFLKKAKGCFYPRRFILAMPTSQPDRDSRGRMQYKNGPRLQIRAVGAFEHGGCLTVSRICSVLGCNIFGDGYASCFLPRTKSICSARRRTDRSVGDVIGNENHRIVIILVHVFSN